MNVYSRVLDDNGNSVADVRSVGKVQESPILRASAPAAFVQHGRLWSPAIARGRLEYSAYRPEAFAPVWQQQPLRSSQPKMAQELQRHLVPASQQSQRSVIPLVDCPSNVAAVELPASGVAQEPEEELLPIFDHSDVFIPAPMVPASSLGRPKTKLPPIEMIQQRPLTQQPTQQQRPAKLSQDVPVMQSTYTSIPTPQHQHHEARPEPQLQECTAASTTGFSPEELQQTVARATPRKRQLLDESGSYWAKAQATVASRTWRTSTLNHR